MKGTENESDNGLESIIVLRYSVCAVLQYFYLFSCTCIFYMAVKIFLCPLLWVVVVMFENCCCSLYSYFRLLGIGGIEQQKLFREERWTSFGHSCWWGGLSRHNSGFPYAPPFFSFSFWPRLWHEEVSGPKIKPTPLQGQCWILNPLCHQGTLPPAPPPFFFFRAAYVVFGSS